MTTFNRRRSFSIVAVLALAITIAAAPLQEAKRGDARGAEQAKEVLARFIGAWNTTIVMGDAEPVEGTSIVRPIEGSTFVTEEMHAELFGDAYMGIGVMGYDQVKNAWVSMWVDSAESTLNVGTSTWDAESQSMIERVPARGETPAQLHVARFTDKDSFVFVAGPDVAEFKPEMVIQYKRHK